MRIVSRAGVSDACHKSITFYSLQARSGIWRPTSGESRYARITTEISKPGRVNGSEDLRRVSRLLYDAPVIRARYGVWMRLRPGNRAAV